MTEAKEKTSSEEIEEKETIRRYIRPEFTLCVNEDSTGYVGEIILPGVEKDSIDLRMTDNYVVIRADYEDIKYAGTFTFGCQVDVSTASSTYKEGLLKFRVDFKEPELKSIEVKVD